MRNGSKESISRPNISNLFHVDFHNCIEIESVLSELELSREPGVKIGEVRDINKNDKRRF